MKIGNINIENSTLQTHHVYSTLKGRGNFRVVSTWNTHVLFVGYLRKTTRS